ncbi:MAG: ABC transporter ATP-binding protein [Burkholderiales bacterium]
MRVSLLEIKGLKVSYGGIAAVRGIDLAVEPGELVAIIGANGAGKTTTLKALAGMLRAASGSVHYDGRSITAVPSHKLTQQGIALVPEGRGIFTRLTVEENLAMGAFIRNDREEVKADLARIFDLFARLRERRSQVAGTLSGGEQQMLAIGRAMMSRPRLLLLDEPSMGLAPLMVRKIFEVIRSISEQGVTILLVEQNARLALQAASRGYVMESGAITLADSSASLLASAQVRQAYLGE